ncbi:MAG: DUF3737 family protein [Acetatifactor sp.]|nr:DUF3737 family protein [Acetatifactor sp.]
MTEIRQKTMTQERAMFHVSDTVIYDSVFDKGESPLKECRNIELYTTLFRWKYPLWYCHNIKLKDCTLFDMARAGIWYTDDIHIEDTVIEAPKNLRRSRGIVLQNVSFPNAAETLWNCDDVKMTQVYARGDYFAFNTNNITADHLTLVGNYSFDGSRNVTIRDSKLLSKDAFWNTENVTVTDSFISGEYLGWNARNLTLINCTIESLQGMCYIDNLVMKNCKLINTTLAFEYSTVEAEICSSVDSVLNPSQGMIKAQSIGSLIIQKDLIDPGKTRIVCDDIHETTDEIVW